MIWPPVKTINMRYLIIVRKHLEVQLAPDLDPHLVDQVDGLVTPHVQLSPVFIQIQSGHIHQVQYTYFRKPDLGTEKTKSSKLFMEEMFSD
jgi:hypothetical protein